MPAHHDAPRNALTGHDRSRGRAAADDAHAPDDLTALPDDKLYALADDRRLDPSEWGRIEDELGRRRRSRRLTLADAPPLDEDPPVVATAGGSEYAPTLGDFERVVAVLEERLTTRLDVIERRARSARRWAIAAPLLWGLVALGAWASGGLTILRELLAR